MKVVLVLPGVTFTDAFVSSLIGTLHYFIENSIDYDVLQFGSSDIYAVRNKILLSAPDSKPIFWEEEYAPFSGMPYDYLMWIDSDMFWAPDDIMRLISHERDIVGGVAPVEVGPRCASGYFDTQNPENPMAWLDMSAMADGTWKRKCMPKHIDGELMRVDFVGFAFLCVKHGVFESMEYPWFVTRREEITIPPGVAMEFFQTEKPVAMKVDTSEDVGWCCRAREAGYDVFIDPTVRVGHKKPVLLQALEVV